jgi:hypothetical protein
MYRNYLYTRAPANNKNLRHVARIIALDFLEISYIIYIIFIIIILFLRSASRKKNERAINLADFFFSPAPKSKVTGIPRRTRNYFRCVLKL